jgi:hypothetical protein
VRRGGEEDHAPCRMCGTTCDQTFERVMDVIGHGLEASGTVYCCAACARRSGVGELTDRV